jgi:hypothetical protein
MLLRHLITLLLILTCSSAVFGLSREGSILGLQGVVEGKTHPIDLAHIGPPIDLHSERGQYGVRLGMGKSSYVILILHSAEGRVYFCFEKDLVFDHRATTNQPISIYSANEEDIICRTRETPYFLLSGPQLTEDSILRSFRRFTILPHNDLINFNDSKIDVEQFTRDFLRFYEMAPRLSDVRTCITVLGTVNSP